MFWQLLKLKYESDILEYGIKVAGVILSLNDLWADSLEIVRKKEKNLIFNA